MSQRTILWALIVVLLVVLVIGMVVLVGGGLFFVGRATAARAAVPATLTATPTTTPTITPTPTPPLTATPTPVPTVAPPATPAPSATPVPVAIDWNAIGQGLIAWLAEQGVPVKSADGASPAATPTPTNSRSTAAPTTSPTATPTATPAAVANVRPGFEGFPLTAQAFYDALQTQPCPVGSEWECKDLELREITPVYTGEGVLNGFEITREDQVEGASTHSIKHFWGCNPWGLVFGYMSDPAERAAMGFTAKEIASLGLPESAVGAGIPGGYCGYLEGISAYRLSPSKLAGFPQTVEERMPAGGVPWESAGWVQTHFELNSDAKVEHQGGKAWGVRPIEGKSDFWACNPDNVGYDGFRAAGQEGPIRPGDHKDPSRSGFPANWCGKMQGFNAWPGGSW